MTNNDVLRRIRYILSYNDSKMAAVFGLADCKVSREEVNAWLRKDDEESYKSCSDTQLASFLNGLINEKRGKKDGPQPAPEKRLNNNIIMMKLKIAFNLKSDDMLELMQLAGFGISKHELSAFFRRPDHKHFRECKDQILRYFLSGLQLKYREKSA